MGTSKHFFQYDDAQNLSVREYIYTLGTFHYNWHEDIELLVVLRGRADVCAGGHLYQLEEDDMILINSNEGHATLARSADSLAFLVRFSPDVFKAYTSDFRSLHFQLRTDAGCRDHLYFRLLRLYMAEMLLAMEDEQHLDLLRFQSGLYPLLALLRSRFSQQSPDRSTAGSSRSQLLVQQMIRFVDEHYKEKITLNSLAEQMDYNPSYLSQLFSSQVGVSFYDYVTRKRLRESTFELQRTDKKVLEIATDNGFQDIKAFNSKFKEVFGRTPTDYRRSLAEVAVPVWPDTSKAYVDREDTFVKAKLETYLQAYAADTSHYVSPTDVDPAHQASEGTDSADGQLLEDIAGQLEALSQQLRNMRT